jgi:hypothetical protein
MENPPVYDVRRDQWARCSPGLELSCRNEELSPLVAVDSGQLTASVNKQSKRRVPAGQHLATGFRGTRSHIQDRQAESTLTCPPPKG